MSMHQQARALYRAFDVLPLNAETADLRVDLDGCRGDKDGVANTLFNRINLAERPRQLVLAGHRGSGKSSEFFSLKTMLEQATPRHFCVSCDLSEHIDVNDVDFLDVLVGILRTCAADLKKRANIDLKPGYLKDRLTRLYKILGTPVALKGMKLPEMLGGLAITIKGSPDARSQLRKAFEPDAGNWMVAANELIGEAVAELAKQGYVGLVVLVDDLDKVARRPIDSSGCTVGENLFVRRAAQLTAMDCHVVYSMPLELAYSRYRPDISKLYGGPVIVLPMTKIQMRPPDDRDFKPGMTAFRDVIDRRIVHAQSSFAALFDSKKTRDAVIRLSGGQPFELMGLIRRGIDRSLPIRGDMIDHLHAESKRDYVWLREEHRSILENAAGDGTVRQTNENETARGELLESRALLQYLNDSEWYRPNPVLADLASSDST